MELAIIAAVSRNGVIGDGERMPWHLPADLRYFKRQTRGKIVIMGRRTYVSIGRPLPERWNIVISRQPPPEALPDNLYWVADPEAALRLSQQLLSGGVGAASPLREVMIIGGGQIYALFLPRVSRLYLTRVDATVDGQTRFSYVDAAQWRCVERHTHEADHENPYRCEFEVLERRADG